MAGTLRRAGLHVVVWNRDRGKCHAVARTSGAEIAESASAAAAAADIAITSLADDAAVRAVYADALEGFHEGQVVLEMSTIAPETVRAIEPSVRARGATLLDAPVSGSVPVVERGELLIMAGGDSDALDRARPVLEAMSSKTHPRRGARDGGDDEARGQRARPRAQRGALGVAGARRTRGRRAHGRLRGLRVGRRRRAVRAVQAGGFRATGRDAGRVPAGPRRQGPRSRTSSSPGRWGPRCHRRRRTAMSCEPPSRRGWPITTSAPWPSTCGTSSRPLDPASPWAGTIRRRRWMQQRDHRVPTSAQDLDERRRGDEGDLAPRRSPVAFQVARRRPSQDLGAEHEERRAGAQDERTVGESARSVSWRRWPRVRGSTRSAWSCASIASAPACSGWNDRQISPKRT